MYNLPRRYPEAAPYAARALGMPDVGFQTLRDCLEWVRSRSGRYYPAELVAGKYVRANKGDYIRG